MVGIRNDHFKECGRRRPRGFGPRDPRSSRAGSRARSVCEGATGFDGGRGRGSADDVVDVSDNDKVKAAASKAAEAKQRWGKALEKARATEPDTKEREAASQEVGRAYEQKVAADEELARVTEEVRKEARAATAQAVLDERQALKQCLRDHSA